MLSIILLCIHFKSLLHYLKHSQLALFLLSLCCCHHLVFVVGYILISLGYYCTHAMQNFHRIRKLVSESLQHRQHTKSVYQC